MQIHLIGHASILVETQDCKILMDPVFWDSHCEGMQDICPKRQIIHEQIPDFDILVISHQHTDHFDIRSLANLPKHVDVLIPKDKFMEECLRKLGYYNIYQLKDFNEVRIGSTHLIATPSENPVPEFGMIFSDSDGVFWNQVDSIVNYHIISQVKSYYHQIDFLLASWQPMLETEYQFNLNCSFPYSVYSSTIELINLTAPKAIAPGANGFKFINGSAWLNQIVFPITRESFCEDVKQAYPAIENQTFIFEPGDTITINNGAVNHLPQNSHFVKKVADDYDSLYFSPVNIDSKLIDDNPDGYDIENMKNAIHQEVFINLPRFLHEHKTYFLEYCRWKFIYQLEVIFPNSSETWYFDFSEPVIQCQQGRNPLANFFSCISASSFYALLKGLKSWDFLILAGYYRCFNRIYYANSRGIMQLSNKVDYFHDPLRVKFPYEESYQKARCYEIKKWGSTNNTQPLKRNNNYSMVFVGNILMKTQKKNNWYLNFTYSQYETIST